MYLVLSRKEEGTIDCYIKYVQFLCWGCLRAGRKGREMYFSEVWKEKGTSDSYIKYVQFVYCRFWGSRLEREGVFGSEGGSKRGLVTVT